MKIFYEKLGKAYMKPYEAGLLSFMATVRREVLPALHQIDEARRDLNEANRVRMERLRARNASSSKLASQKAAKEVKKSVKKVRKLRKKAA